MSAPVSVPNPIHQMLRANLGLPEDATPDLDKLAGKVWEMGAILIEGARFLRVGTKSDGTHVEKPIRNVNIAFGNNAKMLKTLAADKDLRYQLPTQPIDFYLLYGKTVRHVRLNHTSNCFLSFEDKGNARLDSSKEKLDAICQQDWNHKLLLMNGSSISLTPIPQPEAATVNEPL